MGRSTDMAVAWEARYLPDHAGCWSVPIASQERLACDTYRLRIDLPELARAIRPGQFVMLRLAGQVDPLLGRAFALYDVESDATGGGRRQISIVYLVKGKLTRRLATCGGGQELVVWGPLGNGFELPPSPGCVAMVAGGIGYTPFLSLARALLHDRHYGREAPRHEAARRVIFCYGARSRKYLVGLDEFRRLGVELHVATDDGSMGHRGVVTDLLNSVLQEGAVDSVVTCGPDPMMAAVARITEEAQIRCQVSLETPMACGIGACFSCVTRVRLSDSEWDYKRTCVEGPVFNASDIVWPG